MPEKNKETYSIPESDRDANKFDLAGLFKKAKPKKKDVVKAPNEFKDKKEAIKEYGSSLSNSKVERQNQTLAQSEQPPAVEKEAKAKPKPKQTAKEKLVSLSNKWKAPKILKTNLIRGEVAVYVDWKKNFFALSVSVVLAVVLIGAIYGGLLFWESQANKEATQLEDEINIISQKITDLEGEIEVVDIFQSKLDKIQFLLDRHIYWTNFFAFLEKNFLSEAVINGGFSGDTGGEYTFAVSVNSYADVTGQIKILEDNDLVKSVKVAGAQLADQRSQETLTADVVNFSINMNIDTKIFNK